MNKKAHIRAAIKPLVQVLISCFFLIVTFSNTDQIKKEKIITLLNCHRLTPTGNNKEVINEGNQKYIFRMTKESKKIFVLPKARRAIKEAIKTREEIVLAKKLACKTLVEKVSEAVELLSEEDKEVLRDFLCERSYNSKVDKLNAKRNKLCERIEKRYSKEQGMTK